MCFEDQLQSVQMSEASTLCSPPRQKSLLDSKDLFDRATSYNSSDQRREQRAAKKFK